MSRICACNCSRAASPSWSESAEAGRCCAEWAEGTWSCKHEMAECCYCGRSTLCALLCYAPRKTLCACGEKDGCTTRGFYGTVFNQRTPCIVQWSCSCLSQMRHSFRSNLSSQIAELTSSSLNPAAGAQAPAEAPSTASTPVTPAADEESASCLPSYKRQRLEYGADAEGGLRDGEVVCAAPQGPAACYVCKLADVLGRFRPDKVRRAK